ncbi:MAG: D-alanyl-D-alanine carboxypeptidase/D-alanyl-D-alanine-endopeptidase (penicillin-binding protein 4), partial [Candidatus Paceibacteria bacterium]
MAARERRQTPAFSPRLGLLLGANVIAAVILIYLLGGEGEKLHAQEIPAQTVIEPWMTLLVEAESAGGVATPEGHSALAGAVSNEAPSAPTTSKLETRDAKLESRVEGHIRKAVAEAKKRSKGKVTASNCRVAVSVVTASGEELVARLASSALRPASNMKLVTSAAALASLGADWHFTTDFDSPGQVQAGVLKGDLVIRAGGDPFFDAQGNGKVGHLFAPAIKALKALGIREVSGDLVLDEGNYLVPGPGPGWPAPNQFWQEHCALAAGLTANASCLTAVVKPRGVGETAFAELRPHLGGLVRNGSVKTVSASSRLDIAVGATSTKATLRGKIPSSAGEWDQRFSHPDPVGLFGAVMLEALQAGGIRVSGQVRRERGVPECATLTRLRTPLASVLGPINAQSNNAVADQLFFALGAELEGAGTRAAGSAAVHSALTQLGVSPKGLSQVDGSGLSWDDRVTPRQLSSLLSAVLSGSEVWAQLFRDSLAVAGSKG